MENCNLKMHCTCSVYRWDILKYFNFLKNSIFFISLISQLFILYIYSKVLIEYYFLSIKWMQVIEYFNFMKNSIFFISFISQLFILYIYSKVLIEYYFLSIKWMQVIVFTTLEIIWSYIFSTACKVAWKLCLYLLED